MSVKTLIGLTLFILFILTIFSMILGSEPPGVFLDSTVSEYLIINGTKSYLETATEQSIFFIHPIYGAIAIFLVIITLIAVIGLQIFGSGLSSGALKIISTVIVYMGLWLILSILSIPLISSIEGFGTLIYISLTIGYVYGVINKFTGQGGSD